MSRFIPWIVLLGVSIAWGGAFTAIRYLVQYVSAEDLLVWRFIPTSIMVIILILGWHRKEFARSLPRLWWLFLVLGALWLFGYHFTLNLGETVLPAAPAGVIISTYPIFTVFLAAIFLGESLTKWKVAGGLIGFAGTALLMFAGGSGEGSGLDLSVGMWIKYSLITLIAPIIVAFHTIIIRPYLTGKGGREPVSTFVINYGYMAPTGFMVLPLMHSGMVSDATTFPVGFWLWLGFLVVLCTLLANIGYFWALQRIEAGPVSISTYLIPLFSIGYAHIFLGESIGLYTWIAAFCIIVGVIIAGAGGRFTLPAAAQAIVTRLNGKNPPGRAG